MKHRATFLIGAAVGYILGARAGTERYEQIRRLYRRVAGHPTVQETAGVLRAQAGELAGSARDSINDRLPQRFRRSPQGQPSGTSDSRRSPEPPQPPQPTQPTQPTQSASSP
jgi:hypothetical protein